jgi:uncharacterized phiE125 gp8 family phage protein
VRDVTVQYATEITSGPAVEPLTVAEAKAHLRVDHTTDDSYIESLIKAARRTAEQFQGRAYITQTWKLYLDDFPHGKEIKLPVAPVASVSSITYVDLNGDTQTWDSANYQVDTKAAIPRIVLSPIVSWPNVEADRVNAVTITFIAGYGATSASVPENTKHAIKLIISDMYQHRESTIIGNIVNELPMGAKHLLWFDRLYKFKGTP